MSDTVDADWEDRKDRLRQLYGFLYDRFDPEIKYREVSVGEGWHQVLKDLHEELLTTDPDYVIRQVKEKFGGLRFYTGVLSDEGHQAVRRAEERAWRICEVTGQPGAIAKKGYWWRVVSPEIAEKEGFEFMPYNIDEAQQNVLKAIVEGDNG